MAEVWTLGRWVARPGQADGFVAAWREMAEWTLGEFPEAVGTLLRDREQPDLFFSFGRWEDLEQAQAWRGLPGFTERLSRIRDLLEDFEAHLLDPVATAGR